LRIVHADGETVLSGTGQLYGQRDKASVTKVIGQALMQLDIQIPPTFRFNWPALAS
jgi:hypothetical protein